MGGSEKNWGGQKFKTGFCGGVRSSKWIKMGGSHVPNFHIILGGQMSRLCVEIIGVGGQKLTLVAVQHFSDPPTSLIMTGP